MPAAQTNRPNREFAQPTELIPDPFELALANAPYDEEPVTEEEACEAAATHASLRRGEGVPQEEVLAEFGLTPEDFDRMGLGNLEQGARRSGGTSR